MHTPHRRAFVTRLAFHFLWMGLACTGMPALALCIVRHRVTSYDIFLKVLHDQWLLWMHLAGIGLLAAGIGSSSGPASWQAGRTTWRRRKRPPRKAPGAGKQRAREARRNHRKNQHNALGRAPFARPKLCRCPPRPTDGIL